MGSATMWMGALVMIAGCGRLGFDAVALDAVAGDGAPADSPSGACPAFALFCEDFETGDLSRWGELVLVGPSTVEVVESRVRTGRFALEAGSTPNATASTASPRIQIAPPASGTLAARVWINVDTPLVDFNLVIELRSGEEDHTSLGGAPGGVWASTEGRSGPSGAFDHVSTVAVPDVDQWACVELVFERQDAAVGSVQVFVDGASVLDFPAEAPVPTYDAVGIGAVRSDELGFRVFQDDLVVADRRIGCD